MKSFLASFLLVIFISISAAFAQEGIAYIKLKNGEPLSGAILAVRTDKIILQPDIDRYKSAVYSYGNISKVCDGAIAVQYSDITSLYLERSSSMWMIGFPGIPAVLAFALAVTASASASEDSFGGPGLAAALGAIAGLAIGTVVGVITAIVLHNDYGSDFRVNLNDPDDVEKLLATALYEDALPPCLQVLE